MGRPGHLALLGARGIPDGHVRDRAGQLLQSPRRLPTPSAPPSNAIGVKSGSRIVISWAPQAYAKQYEVAISTSETFSPTIETHKVTQTNWAPNVDLTKAANKGTLYWRVAAVDQLGKRRTLRDGQIRPAEAQVRRQEGQTQEQDRQGLRRAQENREEADEEEALAPRLQTV